MSTKFANSSSSNDRVQDQLAKLDLSDQDEDEEDDESRDSREWELDEADQFNPIHSESSGQQSRQQPRLNLQRSQSDQSNQPIGLRMPITKIPAPLKPRAKYVETSLDDLSFSSSSSSSEPKTRPLVIHEQPPSEQKCNRTSEIDTRMIQNDGLTKSLQSTGSKSSGDEQEFRTRETQPEKQQQNRQDSQPRQPASCLAPHTSEHIQPAAPSCLHGQHSVADENEDEEEPPEVPVRRSSQATQVVYPSRPSYAILRPKRNQPRFSNTSSRTDDSPAEGRARFGLPVRPLAPPPLPPVVPPERLDRSFMLNSRQAPRDIWSPSSSSSAPSASIDDDSADLSSQFGIDQMSPLNVEPNNVDLSPSSVSVANTIVENMGDKSAAHLKRHLMSGEPSEGLELREIESQAASSHEMSNENKSCKFGPMKPTDLGNGNESSQRGSIVKQLSANKLALASDPMSSTSFSNSGEVSELLGLDERMAATAESDQPSSSTIQVQGDESIKASDSNNIETSEMSPPNKQAVESELHQSVSLEQPDKATSHQELNLTAGFQTRTTLNSRLQGSQMSNNDQAEISEAEVEAHQAAEMEDIKWPDFDLQPPQDPAEQAFKYWTLPSLASSSTVHQASKYEPACNAASSDGTVAQRDHENDPDPTLLSFTRDRDVKESIHQRRKSAEHKISQQFDNIRHQRQPICPTHTTNHSQLHRNEDRRTYEMDNKTEISSPGPTRRDKWFQQMYKQMHNRPTPEKTLLKAVNSQPDTTQICIKLKSPRTGKLSFDSSLSHNI